MSNFSYFERRNTFGWTLFQKVQSYQSNKIIDYILSLEDAQNLLDCTLDFVLAEDLKYEDRYHPYWRFMSHSESHAVDLIKAGASINLVYFDGNTALHRATYGRHLDLVQVLLEKGVDVNARNSRGCTALHRACVEAWDSCLPLLLFYGADPLLEDDEGYVPFEYSVRHYSEMAQEILFDYSFDDRAKIHFEILVRLAKRQSGYFAKLLEEAEIVSCDMVYSRLCLEELLTMDYHYLEVLLKNYKAYIEEITVLCIEEVSDGERHKVPDFLLKCKDSKNFRLLLGGWFPQLLSRLWFEPKEKNEVCLTQNFLFLLSYGLELTEEHLLVVYRNFGHCDLFKILLHMEFFREKTSVSIPTLFYDIHFSLTQDLQSDHDISSFLQYFVDRPVKRRLLDKYRDLGDEDSIGRISSYPEIPLLVEMARNVFRQYFIKKFGIKTTRRFYTLLKHLPVSTTYKKIISYETTLYHPQ